MHVRPLSVHNAESADERLAGILVDGISALDTGSLGRSLARAGLAIEV